jgi:hypothetical protein
MGSYGGHRKSLARELKKRIIAAGGEGVSVRGGRGTAWGWINVWGPNYGTFTPAQRKAVESVTGSPAGGNCWVGEIETIERILGIPSYFEGR